MPDSARLNTQKEMPPLLPNEPKTAKSSTAASSVLGAISIAFALLAFVITIALCKWNDSLSMLAVVLAAPFMATSLTTSIIGLCLNTGTVAGKRVSKIGCILALSPVLVAGLPGARAWLENRRHYSYVDGVQFNNEKTFLTKYPQDGSPHYTIPDGVTGVADNAFSDCENLTSITLPPGVTSIGHHAFSSCDNLTRITLPDSLTSIGDNAFSYCWSLTSIRIPDGVTAIGHGAFRHCDLANIVIPGSVTSLESQTFQFCTSLTSITLNEGITSIEAMAFQECHSLNTIRVPDSVTKIGDGAFLGCRALASITFPASITFGEGNYNIFNGCNNLEAMTFLGDCPDPALGMINSYPITIYRKSETQGWDETWSGRPVKLISEKP